MRKVTVVAMAAAFLFAGAAMASPADSPTSVSYEELMSKPRPERRRTFTQLPPADQARLMRTHLERCRAAYQSAFTAEQNGLVDEAIVATVPDIYDPASPNREAARKATREITKKASKVFPQPYFGQVFSLGGALPEAGVVPPDIRVGDVTDASSDL